MKTRLIIKLIIHFIILCILRFIFSGGIYVYMTPKIILLLSFYAIILTCFIEMMEPIITTFIPYYKWMIVFLIFSYILMIYFDISLYTRVFIGYLYLMIGESIYQGIKLQLKIKQYQQYISNEISK